MLRVTYKGRRVARRKQTTDGRLLLIFANEPGVHPPGAPKERLVVTQADWERYGRESYQSSR